MVYVGDSFVTVVGATWTPGNGKAFGGGDKKITPKPVTEVIDTNYHPDRASGNAYFKGIEAKIISTKLTSDLLMKHWDEMVRYVQKGAPSYPTLPLVLPDKTFAGDFELQGGGVKAIYLDPSHARKSKRKCDDRARNRSQLSCRRRGVQCPGAARDKWPNGY